MLLNRRKRVTQRALACVIALLSLLAITPMRGYAWGDHGHRTVARVAARYLDDKASAAINEILKADPYLAQKCPNESSLELKLACIASWPDPPLKDERPYTANWHFVDIPVTMVGNEPFRTSSYDVTRDCAMSKRGDCAILALERLKLVLANPKEAPISRVEALKFIVHIVGDLHQPLHNVTDKKDINDERDLGDLGGNTKIVQWLSMETSPRWKDYHWNLHMVWDEGILDRTLEILKTDESGYVNQLVSTLPAKGSPMLAAYQTGDSVAWADEGYKLAVFYAYRKLPAYDENYKYTKAGKEAYGGYILDAKSGYYEATHEVVNLQLKKGGLRLARLLNDLLSQ